jgi:hypothetical protein
MQDAEVADDASTSLGKRRHGEIRTRVPQRKKSDTLAVLLQGMVGKQVPSGFCHASSSIRRPMLRVRCVGSWQVMVELKNDTEIRGYIKDADDAMK